VHTYIYRLISTHIDLTNQHLGLVPPQFLNLSLQGGPANDREDADGGPLCQLFLGFVCVGGGGMLD
jgi:hypothetical protein